MRDYGKIRTRLWGDDKVIRLSDRGKLLFLYLQTCPHGNGIGCFRLPNGYIESDLGWVTRTVTDTLSELLRERLIERCELTGWTFICNFMKHNSIDNPNTAKAMIPFIESVPVNLSFYQTLISCLEPYAKRFEDGYLNGMANRMPNREPNLTQPEPEPKPEPETKLNIVGKVKKQNTKADKRNPYPDEFENFWRAYPRKDGKAEAFSKWLGEVKAGVEPAKLTECARLYAEKMQKEQKELKWIPLCATWLNKKRYEDEFEAYDLQQVIANEPDFTHEEWVAVAGMKQWRDKGEWPNFLGIRPDNLLCPLPKKLFDYVGLPYPVAQESPP